MVGTSVGGVVDEVGLLLCETASQPASQPANRQTNKQTNKQASEDTCLDQPILCKLQPFPNTREGSAAFQLQFVTRAVLDIE